MLSIPPRRLLPPPHPPAFTLFRVLVGCKTQLSHMYVYM